MSDPPHFAIVSAGRGSARLGSCGQRTRIVVRCYYVVRMLIRAPERSSRPTTRNARPRPGMLSRVNIGSRGRVRTSSRGTRTRRTSRGAKSGPRRCSRRGSSRGKMACTNWVGLAVAISLQPFLNLVKDGTGFPSHEPRIRVIRILDLRSSSLTSLFCDVAC